MWDDFINEYPLIMLLVGIYFWVWFCYLRFKFSNRNNWLHLIFFLISFFGWILDVDADWSWLIEPEFKN